MNWNTIVERIAPMLLCGLAACASGMNIPSPGGPPDKQPPVIREAIPMDGTTNFRDRTVRITFDEYLNEGSVPEQIVITPIPEQMPVIDWSGKTLEIEFREPLRENRTYAITLGGGIQDVSGNRLGVPYTLRFSTGPIIDSGRIGGSIVGKGDRDVFIFAYAVPADEKTFSDTLRPDQTQPDFIAPVGDNGTYSLEGLPPGRYRIFAVADNRTDRLYSPGVDAFGVAVQDVTVDANYAPIPPLRIRLGAAPIDMTQPQLFSAAAVNSVRTELRFSEPIDTATIRPTNFRLTVEGADVRINAAWRSPANALSLLLAHSPIPSGAEASVEASGLRDTTGLSLADTARRASFTATTRRDTLSPSLLPIPEIDKGYRPGDTLVIAFDEGVEVAGADEAMFLTDTATGTTLRFRLTRISPAEFLAVSIPSSKEFQAPSGILSVSLGLFTDYAGNRRDSVWTTPVELKAVPQRGSLQGTLTDSTAPNVPHVILLESRTEKWKYRIRLGGTGAWEIKNIPSGDYSLSAFRDTNGDGEYDYGSLSPYRPGEVFTERPGGIQVRPRWTTTDVKVEF